VGENRTHGSEGGDGESRFRPLSDFCKVQLLYTEFNPLRLNARQWLASRSASPGLGEIFRRSVVFFLESSIAVEQLFFL
jgi:hypothetical protein